jgi:RIO-like serine/threonine protein kinase
VISDNGISRVWREGEWIYKQQPKHLTQNEIWCLEQLYPFGYVPYAKQVEINLIKLDYIKSEKITKPEVFMAHLPEVLFCLKSVGIRHGDLTRYAVLVRNNKPIIIDFAESRLICDPRPDKRPEGDEYWLKKTMRELCNAT